MITYTLKIVAIVKETEDTKTVCFKQPALKKIRYTPGQYITLIVNINGRKYKRPYSISSAQDIDATLNVTIKRLPNGVVSNHLVDVVKEGDMLEVIEPMGSFIYNAAADGGKEIFLWGAGSGVTPLMSIIKTALINNLNKINFFYCNKSKDQTIFYDQLIKLTLEYPDRLVLNLFCTNEEVVSHIPGRINLQHVVNALSATDKTKTLHYICGPVGLKDTVKAALISMELKAEQIFSEDFENIIDESELKDVQTQFVKLVSNKQSTTIEVVRGRSILEAGLDSQLDLPYSCQTGSCTLCKAKLISGVVKKISHEKMDQVIADDEQLLCCCYPLTNNVIFEIN
jgi:ring-1,2-phenylacetyl-CoA epoxidase subunit PaaE